MEYSQKLTSHISKTKYIQNSSCDFNAAKLETNNLKKLPSLRPKELKQSNKKKRKEKREGKTLGYTGQVLCSWMGQLVLYRC